MNSYAPPGSPRYIVLVTDAPYHENDSASPFTKQQIVNELTATGCPVYISLWEHPSNPWLDSSYVDLLVNTGEFDPCDYYAVDMVDKYPFALLRDRILGE